MNLYQHTKNQFISFIKVNLFLDGNKMEKSQERVLQGITIDDKLSIKTHVENICRKSKCKLHTLQRMKIFKYR